MTIISPLPNTFVNGTTIDATQINADFAQVVANANANAAHLGANSDITSLTGLTTPLSTGQGGTGRSGGAPSALAFGGGSGSTAGGTTAYYGLAFASLSETDVYVPVPVAGTLRNMYAQGTAAPGPGQTFTYTLRKNLASQALTCQTPDPVSSSHDTTHSVSVVAGDLIDVLVVTSAAAVASHHVITLEFDVTP